MSSVADIEDISALETLLNMEERVFQGIPFGISLEGYEEFLEEQKKARDNFRASQGVEAANKAGAPKALGLYKREGVYYLFADLSNMAHWCEGTSNSIQIWLRSLAASDTVVMSLFSDFDGDLEYYGISVYMAILNTLVSMKAKVILETEFLSGGIFAYFMVAASELKLGPLTRVTFSNPLHRSITHNYYTSARNFVNMLFEMAVKKKILTEEEVATIKDDGSVTLTGMQLLERLK